VVGSIRYFVDEHIGIAVVKLFRRRGIHMLTVSDAGLLGVSDLEHLQRARAEKRVLITK
jgi:predicted nuclease of predicted toxin-antitoxin system